MGFKGKVYIPDGSAAPNVVDEMLTSATSFYSRINNFCATQTDRNTLAATMTTAEKLGTRIWVDERKGWCTFDGDDWIWEPQRNRVYLGYQPATLTSNTTVPGSLNVDMLTPYSLPPGNRRVHVAWGTVLKNSSPVVGSPPTGNRVGGRVTPLGAGGSDIGIPDGRNYAEGFLPAEAAGTGFQQQVSNEAFVILSGNIQLKLFGLSVAGSPGGNAANNVSFSHSWMSVYDLGPADS